MYKVASFSGKNVIATAGIPQAKNPPLSLYETGRKYTVNFLNLKYGNHIKRSVVKLIINILV